MKRISFLSVFAGILFLLVSCSVPGSDIPAQSSPDNAAPTVTSTRMATPSPTPTATATATVTASPTATSTFTATPTQTATATPTPQSIHPDNVANLTLLAKYGMRSNRYGSSNYYTDFAISLDGSKAFLLDEDGIHVHDLPDGNETLLINAYPIVGSNGKMAPSVSSSADGEVLCVTTWSGVEVYQVATGQLLWQQTMQDDYPEPKCAVSPDGTMVAVNVSVPTGEYTPPGYEIHAIPSGDLIASGNGDAIQFSHDGNTLLVVRGSLIFIDTSTWHSINLLSLGDDVEATGNIAVISRAAQVEVWDFVERKRLKLITRVEPVDNYGSMDVQLSLNGEYFSVVDGAPQLLVFKTDTGEQVLSMPVPQSPYVLKNDGTVFIPEIPQTRQPFYGYIVWAGELGGQSPALIMLDRGGGDTEYVGCLLLPTLNCTPLDVQKFILDDIDAQIRFLSSESGAVFWAYQDADTFYILDEKGDEVLAAPIPSALNSFYPIAYWDLTGYIAWGRTIQSEHTIAVLPLADASDEIIRINGEIRSYANHILAVADGMYPATLSVTDLTLNGAVLYRIKPQGDWWSPGNIFVFPDGSLVAYDVRDNVHDIPQKVYLADPQHKKVVYEWAAPIRQNAFGSLVSVAELFGITPSGEMLILTYNEPHATSLLFAIPETGEIVGQIEATYGEQWLMPEDVWITPDGRYLITNTDGVLKVWGIGR